MMVLDEPFIQVHPLFLYESIWCLLLLIVLLILGRRKSFQGEIFLRYLAGYGLGKCGIEWLRTDSLYIPGTKISVSLLVSAVLFWSVEDGFSTSYPLQKTKCTSQPQERGGICAGRKHR